MDITIYSTDIREVAVSTREKTTLIKFLGPHGDYSRIFLTEQMTDELRNALNSILERTCKICGKESDMPFHTCSGNPLSAGVNRD